VKTVWFDEPHPYPVRSLTYRTEQAGAFEVRRVSVYNRYTYSQNTRPALMNTLIFIFLCWEYKSILTKKIATQTQWKESQMIHFSISLCRITPDSNNIQYSPCLKNGPISQTFRESLFTTSKQYIKCSYNVTLRRVLNFAYGTLLRWSYHLLHCGHIICCCSQL
jgi:hypothetical protein